MKTVDYYWEHPDLTPYVKKVPAGMCLFRQGDEGRTLFILVAGIVELFSVKHGREVVVGIEPAGHFLGESAITSDTSHKRVFGARARTDLTYIELSWADLNAITQKNPMMMLDILKRMFQMSASRLARANRLAEILRSSRNVERLVQLILHFGQSVTTARSTPEGKIILINRDHIRFYIDMTDFEIEECFKELERRKILLRESDDFYLLPSAGKLLTSVPALKEVLPNIKMI